MIYRIEDESKIKNYIVIGIYKRLCIVKTRHFQQDSLMTGIFVEGSIVSLRIHNYAN